MTDRITPTQFRESEGVEDWRVLGDGANAYFRTGSYAAGARLVQAISELPGIDDLLPDVDVRHDGVTVRMVAFIEGYGGMLRGHVELARKISAAARKLGLSADPSAVQSLLVIPGATDRPGVMPFWRAVLGYEPRPDSPAEDLVDPRGRTVPFWFEQMKEPRADVRHSKPPAGPAVTTAHWGDYSEMAGAYAALERWCVANGRRQTGTSWEVYGDWADDPRQRRTDIYLLLTRGTEPL